MVTPLRPPPLVVHCEVPGCGRRCWPTQDRKDHICPACGIFVPRLRISVAATETPEAPTENPWHPHYGSDYDACD